MPLAFPSCSFPVTPGLLPTLPSATPQGGLTRSAFSVAVLVAAHRRRSSQGTAVSSAASDCVSEAPPPRDPRPAFSASVVDEHLSPASCPCRALADLPWRGRRGRQGQVWAAWAAREARAGVGRRGRRGQVWASCSCSWVAPTSVAHPTDQQLCCVCCRTSFEQTVIQTLLYCARLSSSFGVRSGCL